MKETPTQGGGVCGEGLSLKFGINLVIFFPPIVLAMKILGFYPGSFIKLCHKEMDFLLTWFANFKNWTLNKRILEELRKREMLCKVLWSFLHFLAERNSSKTPKEDIFTLKPTSLFRCFTFLLLSDSCPLFALEYFKVMGLEKVLSQHIWFS